MFLGYLRKVLFSQIVRMRKIYRSLKNSVKGLQTAIMIPPYPKTKPRHFSTSSKDYSSLLIFSTIFILSFSRSIQIFVFHAESAKKICPHCNIEMDEDKKPVGRDCIGCINCEMKCPTEAITSPFAWPLSKIFLKMNVYKASHDPAIVTVPVKQKNGKLIRL